MTAGDEGLLARLADEAVRGLGGPLPAMVALGVTGGVILAAGWAFAEAPAAPPADKADQAGEAAEGEGLALTAAELKAYDGSDPGKLLVGVRGTLYDVSSNGEMYGKGGSYNLFAGIDASRALAKMSFKPEDLNGDLEGLSQSERDCLDEWEQKFKDKYPAVGKVAE